MAKLFFCFLVALWSACSASGAAEDPALTAPAVTRLITAAEKNVKDPQGWADDLLDVLKLHDLPASKENICASIAIIDQEFKFRCQSSRRRPWQDFGNGLARQDGQGARSRARRPAFSGGDA